MISCVMANLSGPGRIKLSTSGWFYGIFIALLLIILFVGLFIWLKRIRDDYWERKGKNIGHSQISNINANEVTEIHDKIISNNQLVFYKSYC